MGVGGGGGDGEGVWGWLGEVCGVGEGEMTEWDSKGLGILTYLL